MNLFDIISGGANGYVGQNFPSDLPPAMPADGDPLAKLRALFQGDTDIPPNAQPTSGSPIPMPQPRPAGAPQAPMQLPTEAITSFAPTDVQRAARGMSPIPLTDASQGGGDSGFNGLLSAIIPNKQDRNRFTSALAGGMTNMAGNTAGAAIGRGLGGALKGGNKSDDDEFDRGVQRFNVASKYVDAMRKARAEGDETAYKQAQTSYYQALAERAKTSASVDPVTGKASRTATSAIWSDPRARYDKARRAVLASDQAIDGDYTLSKEQKAERKRTDTETIYKNYGLNPDGSAPNAPTTSKRAGKSDEISFEGNGTQAAPYKPTSKADYDQIETGTYYVHPSTGQLKLKK